MHSLCPNQQSPYPACWKIHANASASSAPKSHIIIDFLTDLPESQGNTTILVIINQSSLSLRLVPLPDLSNTFDMAQLLISYVYCYFVPEDIVSHRGPQFKSRVWKSFMEKLGVSVSLTLGCHPQANSQLEMTNQEPGWFLHTLFHENPSNPWAEFTQNSVHHTATLVTLFQCVLSNQPPLLLILMKG